MAGMTFTSQCCNAPIHTDTGDRPAARCVACGATVGNDGAPVDPGHEVAPPGKFTPKPKPSGLFDHISDGMKGMSDEELEQCLKSGYLYRPYIPLQVTKVKLK